MAVDANNEVFEIVTIDGREALFTNLRIDRETVPKGFYCYDIRETEGFTERFFEMILTCAISLSESFREERNVSR